MRKFFYSIVFLFLVNANFLFSGLDFSKINIQGLARLVFLSQNPIFFGRAESAFAELCVMESSRFKQGGVEFFDRDPRDDELEMFRQASFRLLALKLDDRKDYASVAYLLLSSVVTEDSLADVLPYRFGAVSRRKVLCSFIEVAECPYGDFCEDMVKLVLIWVKASNSIYHIRNKEGAKVLYAILKSVIKKLIKKVCSSVDSNKLLGDEAIDEPKNSIQFDILPGITASGLLFKTLGSPSLLDSPFSPKDAAAKVVESQFQDRVVRALSYD